MRAALPVLCVEHVVAPEVVLAQQRGADRGAAELLGLDVARDVEGDLGAVGKW